MAHSFIPQKLPLFLQSYLASYDLSELDIKNDKVLIITSLLNKGDYRALAWLANVYTGREIKDVIEKPVRGMWYDWILRYWMKIFNISLSKDLFNESIIHLSP